MRFMVLSDRSRCIQTAAVGGVPEARRSLHRPGCSEHQTHALENEVREVAVVLPPDIRDGTRFKMEVQGQGQVKGRISGVVRSFMAGKGFGFIQGEDGRDYFVHIKSVAGGEPLVDGQSVEFEGSPSPKGYRATNVTPGELPPPPGQAYESPHNFIWSKDSQARGFDTIFFLGTGWAESNDPNRAREMLKQASEARGGNAVLDVRMEKFSRQQGCSNYYYTVHRYHGTYANVQRIITTTDQGLIAQSLKWQEDFNVWIDQLNGKAAEEEPQGSTSLIPPGAIEHGAKMLWSWTMTIGKILGLALVFFWKQGLKLLRKQQPKD